MVRCLLAVYSAVCIVGRAAVASGVLDPFLLCVYHDMEGQN